MLRFIDAEFSSNFVSTVGVDFRVRNVEHCGKIIKLQVWDTAGQERHQSITTSYYRGAMGIFIVFDCRQRSTFDNIKHWLQQIEINAKDHVLKIVIGNFCDADDREVSREEAEARCKELGLTYCETDPASGSGVDEAFMEMTRAVYAALPTMTETRVQGLQLHGHDIPEDQSVCQC
eukprot:TRINITY_DN295_c0_g1_i2.p1 TRINITY_DN295_c0_g1~~TRINITY_DN295_c0_g1_i2.p1  ORF type:complete len:176 (+),score=13.86 TRINITY_DN295_c0_g1_i2:158-685(+)